MRNPMEELFMSARISILAAHRRSDTEDVKLPPRTACWPFPFSHRELVSWGCQDAFAFLF